jgi:hypothetical protein
MPSSPNGAGSTPASKEPLPPASQEPRPPEGPANIKLRTGLEIPSPGTDVRSLTITGPSRL